MSFLKCTPTVFVIGDKYEIAVALEENGICFIEVNGVKYYEENSGVLSSEKSCFKIRIPQAELNKAGKYTIVYKKTIERKSYFSKFGSEEIKEFDFRPVLKDDSINIYHLADIHYNFDLAEKTASFFGDDTDLYIFNGDVGEVECEENYIDVLRLTGNISKGRIPVIFTRGNHDTRGRLAERYTDYFPAEGKNCYFTFDLGTLHGIVLDCGEDKPDLHSEYGGANVFEAYRRRELEFLKALDPVSDKITFAVSHICPADNTEKSGSVFDIEGEVYESWNRELERIGISFMLSGHVHKAYYLEKNSRSSLRPNPYHVIVGSERRKDDLVGTALTLYKSRVYVRFTDSLCNTIKEFEIKF